MTVLQATLLGIVQGLTEFLPISSSAHLVLVPWLLGWHFNPAAAFVFDVLVQWGTLLAVVAYFWKDLVDLVRAALSGLWRRRPFDDPMARLAWLIALASVPAAVAGVVLKRLVEDAFQNPTAVSAFLLVTAAFLVTGERLGRKTRDLPSLGVMDAVWIGLAQAIALFPGVSRSGSTIAAGLGRGLRRTEAARFSFLMAVPVMFGAGLIALKDLASTSNARAEIVPLIAGFAAAAVVGYLAIRWLLGFLGRRPLLVFAVYCTVVGLAGLGLSVLRG